MYSDIDLFNCDNMVKRMKIYSILSTILIPLMLSCSDDSKEQPVIPDNESGIYGSVIGEWLSDNVGDGLIMYQTSKYLGDGSVHYWAGIAMKGESLYSEYEGVYTYKTGLIAESYTSPITGGDVTDKYTVKYLDNYSLSVEDNNGVIGNLCRIVDTYNLNVGEEMKFETPDEGFMALSYESYDSSIAEVDNSNGQIKAKRRGMTFIKGKSVQGNAAIRVVVTDPENYIDDFVEWIGRPLKDADKVFGTVSIDLPSSPLSQRSYYVIDPLIVNVNMSYAMQKIQAVDITLRDNGTVDDVVEWMDSKYVLLNEFESLRSYMAVNSDGMVMIFFDPNAGVITYMPYSENPDPGPDPNPDGYGDENFEGLEELLGMNAAEAAASLSHEISSEEWEDGFFDVILTDNEVFKTLSVLFDNEEEPYEVNSIMVYLNKGVDIDAVKAWYEENYVVTDDELNPYTNKDKTVFIRFKKAGSLTYVQYRKTKFRK